MSEEIQEQSGASEEAAVPQTEAAQAPTMVPVDALQAERKERQQLQEELKALRDHVSLMASRQVERQQPEDTSNDEEILTVGEAKKYIRQLDQNYRASIEEMKFAQHHKDYEEVINKYLPEVIKKNPRIKNSLEKTQDFELAYELAKNSEAYRRDHFEKNPHENAKRIVENTNRAGNLSQVGSTAPVNSSKNYKQMSDQDFMKEVGKNLGYV